MAKIGINGFGRIGRMTMRAALTKDVTVVMINDPNIPPDYMAYLFKYDSTHGTYPGEVSASDNILCVDGQEIIVTNEKDPRNIPWGSVTTDYVVECSGLYFTLDRASLHLEAGANKVVVSAPSIDVPMFVMGVNHMDYTSDLRVVSNSSCSTHCLAPLCKVLHENFGIKEALMTSIHALTAIQKPVDGLCTKQCRGGRGAGQNIISCYTGTAKAVGKLIPELSGKLTGICFRIPVADVSLVDVTFKLETAASYELIKDAMLTASEGQLKGILGYTEDDIVSSDVTGETYSCFFDANAGISLNDTYVKLIAWHDNEMGYSHRMVDLINHMFSVDSGGMEEEDGDEGEAEDKESMKGEDKESMKGEDKESMKGEDKESMKGEAEESMKGEAEDKESMKEEDKESMKEEGAGQQKIRASVSEGMSDAQDEIEGRQEETDSTYQQPTKTSASEGMMNAEEGASSQQEETLDEVATLQAEEKDSEEKDSELNQKEEEEEK